MNNNLKQIIDSTKKSPNIVNSQSNFVVVTYWWGRGNYNQNTARPCFAFYEDIIKKFIKYSTSIINTAIQSNYDESKNVYIIKNIFKKFREDKFGDTFNKIIRKKSFDYINTIYEYCGLKIDDSNKDEKALAYLEKLKLTGKTPINFEYKNQEYVERVLKLIIKEAILQNEDEIIKLFIVNNEMNKLLQEFTSKDESYAIIKIKIDELTITKKNINNNIIKNLKNKNSNFIKFADKIYDNKNIFDILSLEFKYLNDILFEDMITNWENKCKSAGCNYLAVEYNEFALPGGYQLAINAKPLFIKKMLELCSDRAVLYIDGDMGILKYPRIFDIQDVDFMARGWWMDPRSSYKMSESIMYDPYTFETSGGTMFFSQSKEASILIEKWIFESDKIYQSGKADDRILSLIFNTNKFLCNMKIIQLPIEYLWLSLDYDDRMLEEVYDYDTAKMNESIFIDHPECLTSEDTASGSGASSDRTPKFYSFLENLTPTSEEIHEFIMFPNKEMTNSFKSYFDFMNNITYINDGNEDLIKKGYVDPANPANNEQPLYVIDYDNKYGTQKYPGEKETITQISDINMKRSKQMNLNGLKLNQISSDYIEIQNLDGNIDENKIIPLIIRLLQDGKNVIYNPVSQSEYNINIYEKLIKNKDSLYRSLEFVFTPLINSFSFSNFFKPSIKINQPMLFRPNNPILVKFMSMFISLNDFSKYIENGSYEFMSRVRVGYLFPPKIKKITGGAITEVEYNFENEYENGLQFMYNHNGGKTKNKRIKRTLKKKKKISKKNNKYKTKRNRKNK